MNWFGATGLVTVAKSTLKGAQKAIDKALDIKEDDDNIDEIATPATPASSKDDCESFFSTWGVRGDGSPDTTPGSQEPSSLWGSFTGSFFENARPLTSLEDETSGSPISQQPKRSDATRLLAAHGDTDVDSELALADDRTVWEGFSKTQLVVEALPTVKDDKSCSSTTVVPSDEVKWRRKEKQSERSQNRNSYGNNRLSVLSSESDRRSSDSVEVLGSTSCTASPDSDLPTSLSASSLASSAGLRPVSASSPDSVEVIPDSSVSHSTSVEVLGSHSSSTSICSPLDPTVEKLTSYVAKDLASPESVELVPEEEEDVSFADDSYASASESTMTQATILEPHSQFGSSMESSTIILETVDSSGPMDIIASSNSGRTDSSVSSLILDSSTDTIHSDHGSLGRSGMQLTLTTEYPQPSKNWSTSNQQTSERLSPTQRSHNSSLESIPTKSSASPKKLSSKAKQARCMEKEERRGSESKLSPEAPLDSYGDTGLTLTDSSGEGTLMESSSDDTIPGSDSHSQQSTSGYVKNLLADAMVDDSQIRVNSPVSVESRSDGFRPSSEQTSGHTSGDELETTTSSDIEIISSPNGDGSSTASRQSPAKHLQRTPHGPVDLLKFSGKIKALTRGLEVGALLKWLFIFGLLSYCDACSSRGHPRSPSTTPPTTTSTARPNTTDYERFHECPLELKEYFCLNGATCFELRIPNNSQIYNCFCADGFWGNRCEYKVLDGTYRRYFIETAGIAGGVAIAVVLSFVVFASLYVHMRRKRQRRLVGANNFSAERRPFDKRPLTQDRPEAIQLTSLA